MNVSGLVHLAIYLVVLGVVVALLIYIVRTAPWIDASIKAIASWAITVIGVLIAILMLLRFIGMA